MFDPGKLMRRADFLRIATLFESALVLAAYVIGWLVDVDPLEHLGMTPRGLALGLAATVPLYLLFLFSYRVPIGGMQAIKRFLVDKMGPLLTACSATDLVYLGILAGITEEVLFRGVLQPVIESSGGWVVGLIGSNLVFALAHWITPLYALLAGVTGIYLGLVMDMDGERNLLIPIVVHAVYDILAFIKVVNTYREERGCRF